MSPDLAATITEGRAWAAERRAEVSGWLDEYEAALDALERSDGDPAAPDKALEAMARIADVPHLRLLERPR